MKTEHQKNLPTSQAGRCPFPVDSHQPSPDSNRDTRLSDKAFYLIALAMLLRKSAEPGPKESSTLRTLRHYLVPIRG